MLRRTCAIGERYHIFRKFQWAPTLGGECYISVVWSVQSVGVQISGFNGHPPLGVNATGQMETAHAQQSVRVSFNGHPPLGVNATQIERFVDDAVGNIVGFNGHPPLGQR